MPKSTDPPEKIMKNIFQQLSSGSLGAATIVVWALVAALLAMAGGALSAMRLAGKDLGNALASMMGALFGPVAAVPGILIALIILKFL